MRPKTISQSLKDEELRDSSFVQTIVARIKCMRKYEIPNTEIRWNMEMFISGLAWATMFPDKKK